jgi:hypothetical protein
MVESADLLLDPEIRLWVVVPIIVIAFCIGLCRHYASALLGSPETPDTEKLIHSYVSRSFLVVGPALLLPDECTS